MPKEKDIDFWWTDLELELRRHNRLYAEYAVIASLVNGNAEQRRTIIENVDPSRIREKSFERFLVDYLVSIIRKDHNIIVEKYWLTSKIPNYYSKVWNDETPRKYSLLGELQHLARALDLHPTNEQLDKAIELINTLDRAALSRGKNKLNL